MDPPSVTVAQAARACARGLRDRELADRVKASLPALTSNSRAFRTATGTHQQHTITATTYAVPDLTESELRSLYRGQLAKVGRPGREVASQILAGARHGLCSYCQYGQAKTLDHFVPKTLVAALSIEPWNLVPCCHQCNHHLADGYSTDAEHQLLHPYDMPNLGRWLHARVLRAFPVSVEFTAQPSAETDTELRARVLNQFNSLDLAELYAVVSAQDIAGISRTLKTHFVTASTQQVSDYLQELADGALDDNENSRRGVVLEALAHDAWYCTSGFLG